MRGAVIHFRGDRHDAFTLGRALGAVMNVHADATDKAGERHALSAAPRRAVSHEAAETDPLATTGSSTTPLLTAAQLAERWQVPVRTVYAWAKRNAIPHYRAGRLLRFDPVAVEEHFRRHGFTDVIRADPERPGESAYSLLRA